jgi:hypothetical protein
MSLKLKTLVVAIAMAAAAGSAHATPINTDNFGGGPGLGLGTGAGDLFISILDPGSNTSITLNLNLSANDFRNNNAALANTFSVHDALLQTFLAGAADQTKLIWNLGGISNMGFGPNAGLFTSNGNAGATINPAVQGPIDGNALTSAMGFIEAYAQANSSSFTAANPNSLISPAGAANGFNSTLWGTNFGTALNFNNSASLSTDQLVSFIALGSSDVTDLSGVPVSTTFAGKFHIDALSGTVSYTAVPLPAAVWLLGSGLLGLVGVSRRKNA